MTDENKNVSPNKEEIPFILESGAAADSDPSLRFGWGRFRPDGLQFLNSPKWFLAGIIMTTLFQGLCVMGLTSLTLPSVEKRFSLTGKDLGIITAANDVSALVLVVFISYYGDYGNKIRWIGWGTVILGFGALLYALPHFLIGDYKPSHSGPRGAFCLTGNHTQAGMKCLLESDSRWYYMFIFVLSQLITGAGSCPLFSLLPAYLDENVHPKSMPFYMGAWACSTFIGPGIGMIVGGHLLSIYVDIKQPSGYNLTAHDPRWIGAWWLGFVIFGLLTLVSAFIVLGFPRELPGAKELREKHIKEGNLRQADKVQHPSLKMILPELKNLFTNWTYLFNTLGLTSTLLFIGSLGPFLPKILQLKFGLKPKDTGYAMAAMFTPAMTIGIFIGSAIVKQFPLKNVCKRAALFIFFIRMLAYIGPLSFLIAGCNNIDLAGVSAPYGKINSVNHSQLISSLRQKSLSSSCNMNCHCSLSRFAPVCGSDNITYFDMCHAGCTSINFREKTAGNCSCIHPQNPGSRFGTAKFGLCDRDCKNFVVFVVLMALNIVFQFMKVVPDKAVILRCVPDNKRAFANGVQYILMKSLGLLPGPILFGHVIDSFCRLWQDTCGEKGRCFDYDIDKLSHAVCILGASITLISTIFYFFSWYLYKPEQAADENELATSLKISSEETKV